MTVQAATLNPGSSRRLGRSAGAVGLGFLAVFVLSLGTDLVLHVLEVYPPPELIRRWYGPVGWSLVVCEIDLRVDGAWRFVSRRPDGKQIGQRGVYREIVAPERLVNTESWEDWNPGELLVTTILVEHAGTTTLTMTSLFPSQEVRDMLIKSGMTSGAAETYDKLAASLASMV